MSIRLRCGTGRLGGLPRDSSEHWRLGRLAICLVAAQLAAACASTPDAPENRSGALAESFYVIAPWAQQPPVDITGRFDALNAALSGVHSSVDSYYAGLRAQADAHNSRVFLQAELAREEQRRRELAARPAQTRTNRDWRDQKPAKIDPNSIAPYKENVPPSAGFEAGTAVVGFAKGWRGWMQSTMGSATQR